MFKDIDQIFAAENTKKEKKKGVQQNPDKGRPSTAQIIYFIITVCAHAKIFKW